MFFDDASDGADDPSGTADESSEDTASRRARRLADEADGESVTAARLVGDEQYFPDCLPYLHAEQQPHHLLLLTTSSASSAFDIIYERSPNTVLSTELDASLGGVVVFTEDEVLVVVDDDLFEMPYSSIDGSRFVWGNVTFAANGREYQCSTADSADDAEVAAAYNFLRRKIRERNA